MEKLGAQQFNQPQLKQESFDYEMAAKLARRRLELRDAPESDSVKMERSAVKREAKETASKSSNPEAAKKIMDLEMKIQELVLKKEKEEEGISAGKKIGWPFLGRRAAHDTRAGKEFNVDGQDVTGAELLSDINWGVFYDLGEDVPADFRLKYLEAVYKAQIDNLVDQQLVEERVNIVDKLDDKMQGTYERVRVALENGLEERAGIIFEKMVYNLMSDIAADLPQFGLKVKKLDVIDDVENKIDFVIKMKKKNRAVGIEETEEDESVGIQCTLADKNSEKFRIKEKQVARSKKNTDEIDDLVLVSIPVGTKMVMEKYNEWKKKGKPAGGPEKLFNVDDKMHFVELILQGTELVKDEAFGKSLRKYFKGE